MQYSVINYETVKDGEGSLRLDAEHYRTLYLDIRDKLQAKKYFYLSEILSKPIVTGHTPSMANDSFYGGDVSFVKTDNLREHDINDNFNHYLSVAGNEKIKRSQLRENDVLLTIIGANFSVVGRSSMVIAEILPANINQNIALIRVDGKKFSPQLLAVYLNSFYGRNYLFYLSRQTEQVNLNNKEVERLIIPRFSEAISDLISDIVIKGYKLRHESKVLYGKAEQSLLSELGLHKWEPEHQLSFIRSYLDTEQANRFDAEYFQPKYEDIINAVIEYKNGFVELGDIAKIRKSVEPGSAAYQDDGIPFVRVSNLSKFEISDNNQQFISEELYEELEDHQPVKGEILLSKDATPGIAYYLNHDAKKMIVSSGILKIKPAKSVLPEYLTLVLNSVIVQSQIERDAGGSIINHWRPDQVKKTIIPTLDKYKQEEIKSLVQDSFERRTLANTLLEIAKKGVEMAIEKNDKEAEQWIINKMKELK